MSRQRQKTPEFRERSAKRAGREGTISQDPVGEFSFHAQHPGNLRVQ
jgi:hypothetical protein